METDLGEGPKVKGCLEKRTMVVTGGQRRWALWAKVTETHLVYFITLSRSISEDFVKSRIYVSINLTLRKLLPGN